ncbi:MAG: cupin domain-containing protein [Candidatus Binatia bacterium]
MPFEESKFWRRGDRRASYYAEDLKRAKEEKERDQKYPKAIKPEEMPWEDSPQGRLKHMAREGINPWIKDVDMCMQELPPGGASGKHRHMAEELMYIVEGRGYSLHWDVDFDLSAAYEWKVATEPKRFDWEEGDLVWIPVNTVHQHFNSDPDKPARFISASNRIYKYLGWGDIEQLEEAPPAKKGL